MQRRVGGRRTGQERLHTGAIAITDAIVIQDKLHTNYIQTNPGN